MKYFLSGTVKFIVSNIAVIFAIMLLPVFLVTDSVPVFDQIMDYLFNKKS
ncbi:hypothetical protein GCM10007063_01290 [Lentibacillus kapialis]|uniref:Uncharacterized protein n=1 Tax=Lentibacillus kapialis TaxID=340214 RepID=A0A917PL83_9BACI|nr:hypothetical protein [Lentibacillus kapialis]GGJ82535.1 hypothetical protein GCM10007063_01290 [Lentibacillus kapialis]